MNGFKNPDISIIVPVFNCEKYLSRMLDSMKYQTFPNIEVICINDGSTDRSLNILKEYAETDKRIRVFTQKNAGAAVARNVGLKNARGHYIMFCDSDDWYEPQMCEKMLNAIKEKNVDVVMCHTFFDFESSQDKMKQIKKRMLDEKVYNPSFYFKSTQRNALNINVLLWNKIWKKELIDRYQICSPVVHEHEDDAFWYMYALCSKQIFCLHEKLYHYFIRSGSLMDLYFKGKPKNRYDRFLITLEIIDFLKKNHRLHQNEKIMAQICQSQLEGCKNLFQKAEFQKMLDVINQRFFSDFNSFYYLSVLGQNLLLHTKKKNLFLLRIKKIIYLMKSHLNRKKKYRNLKKYIAICCFEKGPKNNAKTRSPVDLTLKVNYKKYKSIVRN